MQKTVAEDPPMNTPADYEAAFDQYLAEMKCLQEQMDRDQADIERLKAETKAIKAETHSLHAETQAILTRLMKAG